MVRAGASRCVFPKVFFWHRPFKPVASLPEALTQDLYSVQTILCVDWAVSVTSMLGKPIARGGLGGGAAGGAAREGAGGADGTVGIRGQGGAHRYHLPVPRAPRCSFFDSLSW